MCLLLYQKWLSWLEIHVQCKRKVHDVYPKSNRLEYVHNVHKHTHIDRVRQSVSHLASHSFIHSFIRIDIFFNGSQVPNLTHKHSAHIQKSTIDLVGIGKQDNHFECMYNNILPHGNGDSSLCVFCAYFSHGSHTSGGSLKKKEEEETTHTHLVNGREIEQFEIFTVSRR